MSSEWWILILLIVGFFVYWIRWGISISRQQGTNTTGHTVIESTQPQVASRFRTTESLYAKSIEESRWSEALTAANQIVKLTNDQMVTIRDSDEFDSGVDPFFTIISTMAMLSATAFRCVARAGVGNQGGALSDANEYISQAETILSQPSAILDNEIPAEALGFVEENIAFLREQIARGEISVDGARTWILKYLELAQLRNTEPTCQG